MIKENVSLLPYNTFGINVSARYFSSFTTVDQLRELLKNRPSGQLFILGGGSNILLTRNVEGFVLKNELKGIEVIEETEEEVVVAAGAGEVWHEFVMWCIGHNYAGVENLSLIPGSVGASPMQNIGAYGVEIKDIFEKLEAVEISTGETHTYNNEECRFGYRESIFKREAKGKYVIAKVYYRLKKQAAVNTSYGAINQELQKVGIAEPTIKDVSNAVIAIRSLKLPDPKQIGNAGSFFKNPVVSEDIYATIRNQYPLVPSFPADEKKVKIPAGWLIETAGWKGKTMGTYGVHKNQALVLVNYGGAQGNEILQLSDEIIADIHQKFGIELEREVNIL